MVVRLEEKKPLLLLIRHALRWCCLQTLGGEAETIEIGDLFALLSRSTATS